MLVTSIDEGARGTTVRSDRLCVLDGERIAIRSRGSTQLLSREEIVCARAAKNGTWIVTRRGEFKVREPMGAVVERLEVLGIVRIHRGIAVNAAKIRQLVGRSQHRLVIILDDAGSYEVGRRFQKSIRSRFGAAVRTDVTRMA